MESGDDLVVERDDDLADLEQSGGRTVLEHLVEADPALDHRDDAEVFERGDDGGVLRRLHQLEVAFPLLGCGAGPEHVGPGPELDRVVELRADPVRDRDLVVDGDGGEEDLPLGLEHLEVDHAHPIVGGARRPRLQGDGTVVDDRIAGQDPADPLGGHGAVGDDGHDDQPDEAEDRLIEAIVVPRTGCGGSRRRGTRRRR